MNKDKQTQNNEKLQNGEKPKTGDKPKNSVETTDYFERRAKKFLKKFDTLGAELDELRT